MGTEPVYVCVSFPKAILDIQTLITSTFKKMRSITLIQEY